MACKKNRELFVDIEAIATLSLIKEGILSPVERLMNEKEAKEVDESGLYRGKPFPISMTFAPSGKKNLAVLQSAKKGDSLDIICDKVKKGEIKVDEIFEVNQHQKVGKLFANSDENTNPAVKHLKSRLGPLAISGEFEIEFDEIKKIKHKILKKKQELSANNISALMMLANPFHRAHERLLRVTLEKSDLVVIFLLKHSSHKDLLPFDLRLQTLKFFIDNYVHKNRVLVIPFDNTYIYGDYKNAILDCIIAKNFGCNKISFGEYYDGIGMYYDKNQIRTVLENYKDFPTVNISSKFVYCNECKTLVNEKTCPHGRHHHIKYSTDSLIALLKSGILPPAILMRKDISAILLSYLFPNRFKNVTQIYDDLFPGTGLIESHSDRDFYLELMKLYQTTSLT